MTAKPISLERKFLVVPFQFAAGQLMAPQVAITENFSLASFHASVGLAGRTVYFQDTGLWGTQTVAEVSAQEGFNDLDEDIVRAIASSSKLSLVLDSEVAVPSTLWLKLKS